MGDGSLGKVKKLNFSLEPSANDQFNYSIKVICWKSLYESAWNSYATGFGSGVGGGGPEMYLGCKP